jgi:hypothetical protein
MKNFKGFIQTPIMDLFLSQELRYKPERFTKKFAFKFDLTKTFLYDLEFRCKIPKPEDLRPQRNIVIEIFSSFGSGTGKSTKGITILDYIHELNNLPYSVKNNVHFNTVNAMNGTKNYNEIGTTHVIDESRLSEIYGTRLFINKVNDVAQVCRQKGLSFVRIIGKDSEELTINPHIKIDVTKINFGEKKTLSLIMFKDTYRGYIITKAPNKPKVFKNYKKKKDDFIETTVQHKHAFKLSEYRAMVQELVKHPELPKCKNYQQREWIFLELFGDEYPEDTRKLVIERANFLLRT